MKLLVDANLAPELIERLNDIFPGSDHVASVGLERSDTDIWQYAKSHGFTIVSKDNDFEQMAMVYGAPPKVIWIRLGNCRTGAIESLLRLNQESIREFVHDPAESLFVLP